MKKTAYLFALLLAAPGLPGCSTLHVNLDNRLVCTVAKDKSFVVSQWGAVGLSSQIADKDAQVVCK